MRSTQISRVAALALCLTVVTMGGCDGSAKANDKLPPATGPGAAVRAPLPNVPTAASADVQVTSSSGKTTGTTYPNASAAVGPNMSGVIGQVAVEEGDRVKKGQVLFQMRAGDMALRAQQAEAGVKSAQVGVDSMKLEYDRMQRLYEKNAVDKATWERAKSQYEAALAGLSQAQVGLSMARKGVADASVRSPISGLVTSKLKNAGETATMMPPTVVVIVEDHSSLELRFRLPERALMRIKDGDTVTAHFAAIEQTRTAKVVRISPSVDLRTRTVEVFAHIPNADGRLKSGMLANVELADEASLAPAKTIDTKEAP